MDSIDMELFELLRKIGFEPIEEPNCGESVDDDAIYDMFDAHEQGVRFLDSVNEIVRAFAERHVQVAEVPRNCAVVDMIEQFPKVLGLVAEIERAALGLK